MSLFLYHYFEKEKGPFKNLSKLSVQDAIEVSRAIRKEGKYSPVKGVTNTLSSDENWKRSRGSNLSLRVESQPIRILIT